MAPLQDIIHSSLGHKNALRLTSDSDIGIVLSNWDAFHSLEQTFAKSGDTNIRFLVKGIPVDIMPFGDIENPTGYATPANRKDEIRVFAFSDVYKRSEILALPSKNRIHIPTPAGYAVLKLRAWIDRSPEGDYKDAVDLATVAFWYAESQEVATKLWDEAQANDNCPLLTHGFRVERASLSILNREINELLPVTKFNELAQGWKTTDQDLFARYFVDDNRPDISTSERRVLSNLLLAPEVESSDL